MTLIDDKLNRIPTTASKLVAMALLSLTLLFMLTTFVNLQAFAQTSQGSEEQKIPKEEEMNCPANAGMIIASDNPQNYFCLPS